MQMLVTGGHDKLTPAFACGDMQMQVTGKPKKGTQKHHTTQETQDPNPEKATRHKCTWQALS